MDRKAPSGCLAAHNSNSVISFLLLVAIWLLGFPAVSQALNIVMVFDSANSTNPSYDPTGSRLQNIMAEVENTWEDIIKDSGTVTIDYRWSSNTGGLANATSTKDATTGKPIAGDIDVDIFTGDADEPTTDELDWFIDDTPETDEHWDLSQTLYRDLSSTEQAVRYNPNDTPPDLLEVSYRGLTNGSAPADAAGFDLYTSMMHEVGHVLGLAGKYSDAGDVDVETDAAWTGGNDFRGTFDTKDGDIDRGHLASTSSDKPLMCGSCAERAARRFPTATDVLIICELAGWNNIDLPRKDFINTDVNADFNTAGNWIGERVPDANDMVFIRHEGVVEMSADADAAEFFLGYNSYLYTRGHDLTVGGTMKLEQDQTPLMTVLFRPILNIDAGSTVEAEALQVMEYTIIDFDGGTIQVNHDAENHGDIQGYGTLFVGDVFWNYGQLRATDDQTLTLDNDGGSPWRLDGNADSRGELIATDGNIRIAEGDMQVAFDGTITVGEGKFFEADSADSWTLGTDGVLNLRGGFDPTDEDRAKLRGGDVAIRGTVNISEEAAIESQSVFTNAAQVNLDDSDDRVAVFGTWVSLLQETDASDTHIGCTIEAGATFTGEGIVINGENTIMNLKNGANVGVKLTNGGQRLLIEGDDGTGDVTAHELNLMEIGTINFDIAGAPDSSEFDHITVDTDVTIRGSIVVDFEPGAPTTAGNRWTIIDAAFVDGVFTNVEFMGLPLFKTAEIEYFPDHVDVVIKSAKLIGELLDDIPGLFTPGTRIPLGNPQGTDRNFEILSADPDVIGIVDNELVARSAGTATLRLDVLQEDGSIVTEEWDVVVEPEVNMNPGCPPYGLEAQLLDSFGSMDDHLGTSVDVSGSTVIGGSPSADSAGQSNSGKAVVWVRQAGAWVQQATLVAPAPAAGDRAGFSVAIDGNVALIGAPGRGTNVGEVYVFNRNPAGAWAPAGRLRPASTQAGQQFGFSVALSGSFAYVGAPGEDSNGNGAGAVSVFRRAGGAWTLMTELRGSDTVAGDRFGSAIAFNAGMLICGAPGHASEAGAAYLFENGGAGAGIVQTEKLTMTAGVAGDRFGAAVATGVLNGSTVAAVGAPFSDAAATDGGIVAVFEPNAGGAWAEVGTATVPAPAANDRFGAEVAVGACELLASAPGSDLVRINGGGLHRISEVGGSWMADNGRTTPDVRAGDLVGVSIATDGDVLAAGVPRDDDRAQDAGAVYVWRSGGGGKGNLFKPGGGDPMDWIDQFYPNGDPHGGDFAKDEDRDGKNRLLEYIHGANPTKPDNDAGFLKAIRRQDGQIRLNFRLARRAMKDYNVEIEHTANGRFWQGLDDSETTMEVTPVAGNPDLNDITIQPHAANFEEVKWTFRAFRLRLDRNTPGIPPPHSTFSLNFEE